MSKKSDSVSLCIKDERYESDTLLYDVNTARKSFEKKLGQPPKHIYRVPNLKATSRLQEAVVNGDIQQVKKLLTRAVDLSRKWSNGDTPLSYALSQKNVSMVKWLLEHNADPNILNKNGKTPLQFALERAHRAAVVKAWNKVGKYYKIANFLLANGADPNINNQNGKTPLHFAVETQDTNMIEFLLENGANPNVQDKNGKTPLHRAVYNKDNSSAELLLKNRANPNIQDENGETPLFLDVRTQYPRPRQDNGIAKLLLANGANPNVPDKRGDLPLYWAAAIIQSKEMTILLINNGAHPDIMNVGSKNLSLYYTVRISKNKEMTKLLVENGANLHFHKKYCHPSDLVRRAVIEDNTEDVQFFLQYGSFVDIKIKKASNLLEYALMQGHKDMAVIILQNMSDKNISDPSKGALLDAILTKMINSFPKPHKIDKIKSKIERLSELLEIFTVDNPNLNDKAVLFGIRTLPLLEKLFNAILPKQEEINDVPVDQSLEILKHNFKGFIYKFMQVVPVPEEVLEKYPSINELYISIGPRNLKSARKDIVPIEQSPGFLQNQKTHEPVKIVSNQETQELLKSLSPEDDGSDSDVPLSGE